MCVGIENSSRSHTWFPSARFRLGRNRVTARHRIASGRGPAGSSGPRWARRTHSPAVDNMDDMTAGRPLNLGPMGLPSPLIESARARAGRRWHRSHGCTAPNPRLCRPETRGRSKSEARKRCSHLAAARSGRAQGSSSVHGAISPDRPRRCSQWAPAHPGPCRIGRKIKSGGREANAPRKSIQAIC